MIFYFKYTPEALKMLRQKFFGKGDGGNLFLQKMVSPVNIQYLFNYQIFHAARYDVRVNVVFFDVVHSALT